MKLSFSIAIRFLKSNIMQTIIIILGIGIGVSVQIFIGSLIQGLQKGLVETTIGNSSQITITSKTQNKQISNYNEIINTTKKSDKRIKYISPAYDSPAFFADNDESQSVIVRGFELDKAQNIYKISKYIIEGKLPTREKEIILGEALKKKYSLKLNDEVSLITPEKRTIVCKVTGFFDLKVSQINNNWCITTLESAQGIFGAGDIVSSIEIQVNEQDVFLADEIATNIKKNISNDIFKIENWKELNEQLLSGLQGQSISSLMIQIFVMISVVLGIASTLAITVMQKSKQIGILKAMGIKNSKASLIFLFEGLILGIFGALVGIALGIGLAASFTTFAVNSDGTPVVALYIDNNFIALSGMIAVLACIIASLIPASKSSKLNPIDIIRNN
jgi:lipoprotein-releasing system permease protein